MKHALLILALSILMPASHFAQPRSIHFSTAKVFNGKKFVKKEFFVCEGYLAFTKPHHIDSAIDLKGKYVIPHL